MCDSENLTACRIERDPNNAMATIGIGFVMLALTFFAFMYMVVLMVAASPRRKLFTAEYMT